jgi:hypothetical protein
VEEHLTRVNGGHLVRVVGPAFEMVRQWAEEGVPLSVVFRGIDLKAERHRAGRTKRPLRIEFCEADVRETFETWRRALGLAGRGALPAEDTEHAAEAVERKRPSLAKHLDRAVERLGRSAGRLDLPEALRDALGDVMTSLTALRETARGARGADRDAAAAHLPALDRQLLAQARASAPGDLLESLRREAERDLAAYRDRLSGDAWRQTVDAAVDQLLRERLGLPTLEIGY